MQSLAQVTVQRQLQVDPLSAFLVLLFRRRRPVIGLVIENAQRSTRLVEVDAVDTANELTHVAIDSKWPEQFVLTVVFRVDDAPALAIQFALAGGKAVQALAHLFELQAQRRPPCVGTEHFFRNGTETIGEICREVFASLAVPWSTGIAAEIAEHLVQQSAEAGRVELACRVIDSLEPA